MTNAAALARLPRPLRRHILHFEALIEDAARALSASLPAGSRVLDAGAGECHYAHLFDGHRYIAVDLGIGDPSWNYRRLDCIADLEALPIAGGAFDAAINLVTLEHVRNPARVVAELARAVRPGGTLLMAVPMEWEVHQAPHDYFRYTCHGVRYLLESAGFGEIEIVPAGGFFRLLARRLLGGLQFFPGPLWILAAAAVAVPALLLPFLDALDRERNFTLGYVCLSRKTAVEPGASALP
ncbi:MAG: class I SAM-dependent methyltransferase [Bryobacteraceae bacterium]